MSLQVGDSSRRGRSKSPGRRDEGRDRDRDRSRGRDPEDDPVVLDSVRMPSPPAGYSYADDRDPPPRRANYQYDDPRGSGYNVSSPTVRDAPYRQSRESVDSRDYDDRYSSRRDSKYGRGDNKDRDRDSDKEKERLSGAAAFLPAKYSQKLDSKARDSDSDKEKKKSKKDRLEDDIAYGNVPYNPANKYSRPEDPPYNTANKYSRPEEPPNNYAYAKTQQWEYDKSDDRLAQNGRNGSDYPPRTLDAPGSDRYANRAPSPGPDRYANRAPSPGPAITSSAGRKYHPDSHSGSARSSAANVLTVEPGSSSSRRERSPAPPTKRLSSLSVNTGLPALGAMSLAAAPGSPLLESYHGTYQSMSPMPSPLLLASNGPGGFPEEPLSPGVSDDERGGKKKRRARFSDPVDDAARLAKALKGEKRAPDTEPLIEILPGMTHEQIMELRVEYKRLVKTGSDRKGVNIAKHIRARLKDEDPLLMKACYSVALGKWESEAYWANFWYQGDKTRRELLIESIMGRTNDEIRKIKDGFSDKKYRDSLTQCMKTELKEDKFKKAVLMVLDERRMEETDEYGRLLPINKRLVEDDAEDLYRAVKSDKGGESAMIQIVIMRSDAHLREVLKVYEKTYRSNFARDALKKSGNLVGELLAHILNGVINKPVRDALLLHHALTASKKDELRRELLISRLVRFHWDRHHLAAIKKAYRERYQADLSSAVRESVTGEWGLFCQELIVSRMPDDVKRFSKVEIIDR